MAQSDGLPRPKIGQVDEIVILPGCRDASRYGRGMDMHGIVGREGIAHDQFPVWTHRAMRIGRACADGSLLECHRIDGIELLGFVRMRTPAEKTQLRPIGKPEFRSEDGVVVLRATAALAGAIALDEPHPRIDHVVWTLMAVHDRSRVARAKTGPAEPALLIDEHGRFAALQIDQYDAVARRAERIEGEGAPVGQTRQGHLIAPRQDLTGHHIAVVIGKVELADLPIAPGPVELLAYQVERVHLPDGVCLKEEDMAVIA